eukprot:m.668681 g.668681  ORF g.668681 m.668681 type:complete len:348 (-) comp58519_c0_seq21:1913-2956(-)
MAATRRSQAMSEVKSISRHASTTDSDQEEKFQRPSIQFLPRRMTEMEGRSREATVVVTDLYVIKEEADSISEFPRPVVINRFAKRNRAFRSTIAPHSKSYLSARDSALLTSVFEQAKAGACLHFKDLCYSIPAKRSKLDVLLRRPVTDTAAPALEILKKVNGYAMPGQLTALMGSSGAGKTTLLDVLALRKTGGIITGDVTLNGKKVDPERFKLLSGYSLQDESFYGVLTAKESLMFAMKLRAPHESDVMNEQRVDALLTDMSLQHVMHTRVGTDFTRGLSGGERKRLSVALQLVSNPLLLFLDGECRRWQCTLLLGLLALADICDGLVSETLQSRRQDWTHTTVCC